MASVLDLGSKLSLSYILIVRLPKPTLKALRNIDNEKMRVLIRSEFHPELDDETFHTIQVLTDFIKFC